jgi:hypothetical protein
MGVGDSKAVLGDCRFAIADWRLTTEEVATSTRQSKIGNRKWFDL